MSVGTFPSYSAMLSKGDNYRDFLFAYLEVEVVPIWDLILKERIYSDGLKSFFFIRRDPNLNGRQ